ncbi:hypothetical protein SKAU_G00217580 [Synaphobranchus kaupii]|uniref:Uncharacterized protein n=1 Tax=Synaphobranchus kaupii TaxID=118154 RepID=A0A9Q1FA47_SYNKA|nr:hypothetical protein SKAU_G00217580 [Synaphobranchus kaupii]
MADLLPARLRLYKPAFFSTGMNCFSGYSKIGRCTKKRWGIIFKCLTTRQRPHKVLAQLTLRHTRENSTSSTGTSPCFTHTRRRSHWHLPVGNPGFYTGQLSTSWKTQLRDRSPKTMHIQLE